jgi:hypothetical protein
VEQFSLLVRFSILLMEQMNLPVSYTADIHHEEEDDDES